jgi:putative hydrolase of the HAD superfamily
MAYQAAIFDLFGTLVDTFSLSEHRRVLLEMAEVLGARGEDFVHEWFNTFHQRCVGAFDSVEGNILAVCQKAGGSPQPWQIEQARQIRFDLTRRHMVPRPGGLEVLTHMKQRGVKLGLISDCSAEVRALWPTGPLAPFFDTVVLSFEVKLCKPDPRIYELACQRLAVQAAHCMYVGDGGSRELSGAQAAGMHAVLFRPDNEDGPDVHRVNAEPWTGPRVGRLEEVLDIVAR